jgi:hypothetical protein
MKGGTEVDSIFMAISCEHGNETTGFIKGRAFLDK